MSDAASETEGIIRVMSETLANKIAAGEVVQRPASVLKELVENALDAGADRIEVVIKSAGSELVQVIDNGSGMHPADAKACFKRHATSKIRSVEDLERLHTLGFRGEALASIAAVAVVELKTKRVEDDAGLYVRVEGGKTAAVEPCAAPDGTSMAVRNLFYNVPARRNFLKTPATEFKHLVETFQFLALANPKVAFSMQHDEREVYDLRCARAEDPFEALSERVEALFGEKHARHLIPVEDSSSYLSVWGFIGEPDLHRRNRSEQFLFVNDRYVKHHYLEHAIRSAFEGLLPEGTYPFFTLFMDMDPGHVDVNVHPTKAEVKFDDESGLYRFLKHLARRALGMGNVQSLLDDADVTGHEGGSGKRSFTPKPIDMGAAGTGRGRFSSQDRPPFSPRSPQKERSSFDGFPGDLSQQLYDLEDDEEKPRFGLSIDEEGRVWQLQNCYILTLVETGLLVVDQSRAHERVLYEESLRHMVEGAGPSQQLLFPHTVDLNPADHELLEGLMPDLEAAGFDLEFYSGRSVVVRGVPAEVDAEREQGILEALLEQYKALSDSAQMKEREALARGLARQQAVPAGKTLSEEEMRSLLQQLAACEMPYTCPQGRRTYVKIAFDELDHRLGS